MTTHAPAWRQLTTGHFANVAYEECLRRLAWESVGRLGITEVGRAPSIYPVNYAYHDGAILFRTTERRAQALLHNDVSFEIDRVDPVQATGWSVLVRGRVAVLDDSPLGAAPVSWAPDERTVTVSLVPIEVTGREIVSDRRI